MLAQFSDVPGVEVVGDPQFPLVLIAFIFRGLPLMDISACRQGGESSRTRSSSIRSLTACSHRLRVAKGQTDALFLLILMEIFSTGYLDIRRGLLSCVLRLRLEAASYERLRSDRIPEEAR